MDTQLLRNAYVERSVEEIGLGYGAFCARYLGVVDPTLEREFNLNAANNYILVKGYNQREKLTWPVISSEQVATTSVAG
jgi:hypothetical protein